MMLHFRLQLSPKNTCILFTRYMCQDTDVHRNMLCEAGDQQRSRFVGHESSSDSCHDSCHVPIPFICKCYIFTSVTGKSCVYTAAEFACGARPSPTAQPSHPQTWELQGSAQPCAFYSRDQYVLLTSVWHLRKQEEIPWNLSPFSCLTRPSMTYWWFAADYKMFPGVGHQSVVHPVHCTVESREESWNLTEAEGLSYIAKLQVRWRSKQARFHTTWPSQVFVFFFFLLENLYISQQHG